MPILPSYTIGEADTILFILSKTYSILFILFILSKTYPILFILFILSKTYLVWVLTQHYSAMIFFLKMTDKML